MNLSDLGVVDLLKFCKFIELRKKSVKICNLTNLKEFEILFNILSLNLVYTYDKYYLKCYVKMIFFIRKTKTGFAASDKCRH